MERKREFPPHPENAAPREHPEPAGPPAMWRSSPRGLRGKPFYVLRDFDLLTRGRAGGPCAIGDPFLSAMGGRGYGAWTDWRRALPMCADQIRDLGFCETGVPGLAMARDFVQ